MLRNGFEPIFSALEFTPKNLENSMMHLTYIKSNLTRLKFNLNCLLKLMLH